MATVSLFWNTNMATMTSCEYALYVKMPNFTKTSTNEDELFLLYEFAYIWQLTFYEELSNVLTAVAVMVPWTYRGMKAWWEKNYFRSPY